MIQQKKNEKKKNWKNIIGDIGLTVGQSGFKGCEGERFLWGLSQRFEKCGRRPI